MKAVKTEKTEAEATLIDAALAEHFQVDEGSVILKFADGQTQCLTREEFDQEGWELVDDDQKVRRISASRYREVITARVEEWGKATVADLMTEFGIDRARAKSALDREAKALGLRKLLPGHWAAPKGATSSQAAE